MCKSVWCAYDFVYIIHTFSDRLLDDCSSCEDAILSSISTACHFMRKYINTYLEFRNYFQYSHVELKVSMHMLGVFNFNEDTIRIPISITRGITREYMYICIYIYILIAVPTACDSTLLQYVAACGTSTQCQCIYRC